MSDTPETDAQYEEDKYNAAFSAYENMRDLAKRLERERDAYKAQRDRLAEALRLAATVNDAPNIEAFVERGLFALGGITKVIREYDEALAAVKGEDEEPMGWCKACGAKARFCVCDENANVMARPNKTPQ